jgi:hypothetical protein
VTSAEDQAIRHRARDPAQSGLRHAHPKSSLLRDAFEVRDAFAVNTIDS